MPADPILTLAWLVLAHLVADFLIQTTAIVMAKNSPGVPGWLGLAAHALGVAACLVPFVIAFGAAGLWALLVITSLHVIVDRSKVLLTRRVQRRAVDEADRRHEGRAPAAGLGRAWTPMPAAYFAADQAAHIAVTILVWWIWLAGQPPTDAWSTAIGNLLAGRDLAAIHDVVLGLVVIAGLLIANVRAGALFVATLVRPIELGTEIGAMSRGGAEAATEPPAPGDVPSGASAADGGSRWVVRLGPIEAEVSEERPPGPAQPAADSPSRSIVPPPTQVGATIGILERLLIVTFTLIGADAAIGLVIAAKTIARFRLLDDRDFAEYYLLGTLGSVSVAILTGVVARAALAA